MKKAVILLLSCLLICFNGCDIVRADAANTKERSTSATTEATSNTDHSEEDAIIDMFIQYGTYYNDGWYRFNKNSVQGDVVFGYTFSYNPSNGLFVCSTMVTTNVPSLSYVMSDYGAVVFQWGDLENGYFTGNHSLEDIAGTNVFAEIGFEYSSATTYKITTNTYSQLSQADIQEYAGTCYQCMEQGLIYANTIISAYTDNITLE